MTAPVPVIGTALAAPDRGTEPDAIVQLLHLAVEKQVPVEMLERLNALHERVSDRAAAREFADALARFQDLCPPILKNRKASFATKSGGRMEYRYAEIDHIARTIRPWLKEVGLSYSWDCTMASAAVMIVTCTLRHVNGHSEASTFPVPTESNSAASAQQKAGAAQTYARRQSLVQVLGLTTTETDTDAANPEPISGDELADLLALIEEVTPKDKVAAMKKRLLKAAQVERLEDIPKAKLATIVTTLREYGAEQGDAKEPAK